MTDVANLKADIERLAADASPDTVEESREAVGRMLMALGEGQVRAAEKGPDGWAAVQWVKTGILLAFRVGRTTEIPATPASYFDRDTLPLRDTLGVEENIRIVPGGSSVRAGAYLAEDVVIMPPAFVNIGAYVDRGAMIDSHALVGSCAQVGCRVHLSAGAQLGGVLEPVGLRPVIVEDDALVGGNVGVFEGTLVGARAVIAPGVQLTASTTVYDLVTGETHTGSAEQPLSIPEAAVVVPGSRPARGEFSERHGLHLYAPVIVKYRDESTDAATALEQALR